MSLRKGVQYLLQAYARFQHPRKSLTFAGTVAPDFIEMMKRRSLWPDDARVLGHVPQPRLKDLMSRSHVLVLPSIEEGLAMVQAQAMACGLSRDWNPPHGRRGLVRETAVRGL